MATDITQESLVWIKASCGESVPDAIVGGTTCDGDELHLARGPTDEELTPGKLHIGHEDAYLSYGGDELTFSEYEVLSNVGCVDLEWINACGGAVPIGAIEGGTCNEGQPIYIARAPHEGDIVPGKLVPRCNAAFVPWGGQEHMYEEYEVLCIKAVKPPVATDC